MEKGVLVHSKDEGDDIPYKDWKAFLSKVDKAIEDNNQQKW